jgi:hypothetical protein
MSEHEHQYIIPVEWAYSTNGSNTFQHFSPRKKEVVKLRCACGEEIAR